MKKNVEVREKFLKAVAKHFGEDKLTITREEIGTVVNKFKIPYPNWLTVDKTFRAARGVYYLAAPQLSEAKIQIKEPKKITVPSVKIHTEKIASKEDVPIENSLIPEEAQGYVPFGNFDDVRSIVKSGKFYPVYITGLSGNGKTMMVEQVHAILRKEYVRVNITIETDEDDLIGGFRLVDGATVWQNGPVIVAMERGCSLLLDEVDLGSNKMMCLQPILEGKPIYLKKINKMIHPKKGFNVFATANTKGKGSDDGRFIGANILNEAFLERFSVTMEQEYPDSKVETKILQNVMNADGNEDQGFIKNLVQWAEVVRNSFNNGAISEIISTRRLVHICQAYAIFNGNREKAISLCINRFDSDTKSSFMQLYEKVDDSSTPKKRTPEPDSSFEGKDSFANTPAQPIAASQTWINIPSPNQAPPRSPPLPPASNETEELRGGGSIPAIGNTPDKTLDGIDQDVLRKLFPDTQWPSNLPKSGTLSGTPFSK